MIHSDAVTRYALNDNGCLVADADGFLVGIADYKAALAQSTLLQAALAMIADGELSNPAEYAATILQDIVSAD